MRRVLTAPCPTCSKDIQYIYETERIPYFSEVMFASAVCENCGFKSVETYVLGEGDPCKYSLKVTDEEDLSARVIRSTSAEMEIAELGIHVTPGPMCEAFISNVEGVLLRFDDALNTLTLSASDEDKVKIQELKAKIADARDAKFPFTLTINDPSGNSGIVSKKVVKTKIEPAAEDNNDTTGSNANGDSDDSNNSNENNQAENEEHC